MKKVIYTLIFLFFNVSILLAVPKLDQWNGVAYAVKNYLKNNANDPKSIEYVECSVLIEFTNGWFSQRVKFRGKNAFGGLILNEKVFFMTEDGYDAKVFIVASIDEVDKLYQSGQLKIKRKYDIKGNPIY
jgi:hypothetical protein